MESISEVWETHNRRLPTRLPPTRALPPAQTLSIPPEVSICCLFTQKSILCVCNVGYTRGVYPVLCVMFYNFMEFIHMYTYTTAELQAAGFIEEVRAIFTPQKTEYAELPEIGIWFFPFSLSEFLMQMRYFHTEMDIELDKDYFEKSAWVFSDEHILELQAAYCRGGWEFLETFGRIVRVYEKDICDNLELFIVVIAKMLTA